MRCAARLFLLIACLALSAPAWAQFGHPLKGTWSGDWGTSKEDRHRVLLEIHWDGKSLSGTINPGPNGVPLKVVRLDPDNWTVHFEADGADRGNQVHYVIDGKLENLGAYQRFITGTWSEGSTKGDFRVVRN
jgi:hypothetical protein